MTPLALLRGLVLAALVAACGHVRAPPVEALDARHAPLAARFDADAGRVRLLVLASPT